jgi:hypothetical protein
MNNHQVVETSGGGRISSQIHMIPRDDRLFHHLDHRVDTVLDGEDLAVLNSPQSNTTKHSRHKVELFWALL